MSTPQQELAAGDRGPLVVFASWLTMSLMCLATFAKVATKISRVGIFQMDDGYMVAAMLAAVGHSVAVYQEVNAGLGQHVTSLTQAQIDGVEQGIYASQMLYILSLAFAKLALLQIYTTFARHYLRTSVVKGLMCFVALWAVVALLPIAFQCHLPTPWAIFSYDQCINQPVFWDTIGAFDALTDVCIALLPVWLLYDLQLPFSKRALIMIAFTERILVLPLTILRLVYISSTTPSTDPTFAAVPTALTTVVNINLSIILACIPFLKPFLDSLQIGMFNSDPRFLVTHGGRTEDVGSGYYEIERSAGSGAKVKPFLLGGLSAKRKSEVASPGPDVQLSAGVRSPSVRVPAPSAVKGGRVTSNKSLVGDRIEAWEEREQE
ncbi:hypothetical protein MMC15_004307 [Xylographa vitiligo]|nr:hypothetical protein [Xylographa vitiligo]